MNRYQRLLQQPWTLLDGALGTELEKALPEMKLPWSLDGLITRPDLTRRVHERYIEAGADVITINGFRSNARTLQTVDWESVGLDPRHPLKEIWRTQSWDRLESAINRLAVGLALEARERSGAGERVCVAGNLAPLEDCFAPGLSPPLDIAYREHRTKALALKDAGVDLILIETMNRIDEAEGALQAALETGTPVWISFACWNGPTLIGGEPLSQAIDRIAAHLPGSLDAVLVNCTTPEDVDDILPKLAEMLSGTGLRFGAYANVQSPDPRSVWRRRGALASQDYVRHARRWLDAGAWIVGGCCGTTPDDISQLHECLPLRLA